MDRQRDQRDVAVKKLRALIVAGRYRPGEIFSQAGIAEDFRMSRTPVREAVAVLVREGLLDQIPQVGIAVHEFTRDELEDLIQTRHMIETHVAARLASLPPTDDDVAVLTTFMDRMRAAAADEDHVEFLKVDASFHAEIARRGGFFLAADLISSMGDKIRLVGLTALSRPGGIAEVIEEHSAIVEAIVDRSPERAASAMEAHLRQTMDRIRNEKLVSSASSWTAQQADEG